MVAEQHWQLLEILIASQYKITFCAFLRFVKIPTPMITIYILITQQLAQQTHYRQSKAENHSKGDTPRQPQLCATLKGKRGQGGGDAVAQPKCL
jgi:hypothetical protein